MAYLRRKTDDFLLRWKQNPDRKPLVVKGPRQIGKTETIWKFGAENYEQVIEINFVEEPKYKLIVEEGYKTADIIKNISRMDPSKKFIEGKTLLFFDELQEFPEIVTALKFFCQDGRFDVICSGSMPGINYGRIESNSIGYKEDYQMHSFDFEEFLWAKGYDDSFTEELRANRNLGVYKGALYENVVGEALAKSGYGLYYYKRENSTLEEDFFVRTMRSLIPVEVKATNGRAKSLRVLIESDKYEDIHYGIKFTGGNVGMENQIYTFPYFLAFLLKRYLAGRM